MTPTTQETNTATKLNIRKSYGQQRYFLTLKEGQRVEFLNQEGCIYGGLEIRNGELYLMKHRSLKGHTVCGESFGEVMVDDASAEAEGHSLIREAEDADEEVDV